MKNILFFLVTVILAQNLWGQELSTRLEKKIKHENYNAVERIIKKEIRKHKKGHLVNNESGSTYTSHAETIEKLVLWLKMHEGVEEVFSDKCEIKIAIYPGWSVIGVKYKKHSKEICYHVQEGKLGNIKIGKRIRFHLFPARNVLKYIKSFETEGFIDKQKINCKPTAE